MASLSHREPLSQAVGKRMVVTGPDYIKDHLPKLHQHTAYIGETRPALEKTGDLKYLWRAASNRSMPARYKYQYVGEVGWGIPEYNFINKSRLESGFHIKHGELSDYAVDKLTHRYQNPCLDHVEQKDKMQLILTSYDVRDQASQRRDNDATLKEENVLVYQCPDGDKVHFILNMAFHC